MLTYLKHSLITLTILLVTTLAHSYDPVLHTLIFQIALDELPVRKSNYILDEANRLVEEGCKLEGAATASWLDNQRFILWHVYHFNTSFIYNPQNLPTDLYKPKPNDIKFSLNSLVSSLENGGFADLAPFARSTSLRMLVHLIGDAHQPLHAIRPFYKASITQRHPSGNTVGGNTIPIRFSDQIKNPPRRSKYLHALWDNGGHIFKLSTISLNEKDFEKCFPEIEKFAIREAARFVVSGQSKKISKEWRQLYNLSAIKSLSVDDILKETAQRAIAKALHPLEDQIFKLKTFEGNTILINPAYFQSLQKTTQKQVVTAGIRLGRLLDRIITVPQTYGHAYKKQKEPLFKPIFFWIKSIFSSPRT